MQMSGCWLILQLEKGIMPILIQTCVRLEVKKEAFPQGSTGGKSLFEGE
jgi:hypothetical protein